MYSKLTIENRSAIKRFSHSKRFKVALDILDLVEDDTLLDYGTGDGHFILSLSLKCPGVKIVGYEPVEEMFNQLVSSLKENESSSSVSVIQKLESLSENSFDKITCFEVLEHLSDEMQRVAIGNIKLLLKKDGLVFISVPIEVGLSALVKNLIRFAIGQSHRGTNFLDVIKSVFGIRVKRENAPYVNSHLGFYYFNLEKIFFEEGLIIKQKIYSPFNWLRGIINSQVFYILSQP